MVEQAPQKGCHQCLYSQGESQLPPASLGGSPRSASGSDPGCFQITASVLGLRAYEVLYVPFKSGVSGSYRPSTLLYTSPVGLQSQAFWNLVLSVQDPQAWKPDVGLRPLTPWGEPLRLWLSSHLWVVSGWWVDLDCTASSSLLFISLWVFLYIFSCRKSFLLVQVMFIDSCSVNIYNMGVPMVGSELRVFLLCHLATAPVLHSSLMDR